jgi:hypothetical protein
MKPYELHLRSFTTSHQGRTSEGHQTFALASFPTIPKCGSKKCTFTELQMRSADEVHYVRNVIDCSINGGRIWWVRNVTTTMIAKTSTEFHSAQSLHSQLLWRWVHVLSKRLAESYVRDCDLRMLVLWHDGARDFCIIGFRRTLSENQIVYHGPWAVYEACGRKTRYRRSDHIPVSQRRWTSAFEKSTI